MMIGGDQRRRFRAALRHHRRSAAVSVARARRGRRFAAGDDGGLQRLRQQGVYIKPRYIRRIADQTERVLEEQLPELSEATHAAGRVRARVHDAGTIDRGTAYEAHTLPTPLAGKTGTTNGYTDAWFIGFSPEYTVGVWVGYDDPSQVARRRRDRRRSRAADLDRHLQAVRGAEAARAANEDFDAPARRRHRADGPHDRPPRRRPVRPRRHAGLHRRPGARQGLQRRERPGRKTAVLPPAPHSTRPRKANPPSPPTTPPPRQGRAPKAPPRPRTPRRSPTPSPKPRPRHRRSQAERRRLAGWPAASRRRALALNVIWTFSSDGSSSPSGCRDDAQRAPQGTIPGLPRKGRYPAINGLPT